MLHVDYPRTGVGVGSDALTLIWLLDTHGVDAVFAAVTGPELVYAALDWGADLSNWTAERRGICTVFRRTDQEDDPVVVVPSHRNQRGAWLETLGPRVRLYLLPPEAVK